jgi:hypothetical protein
MGDKYKGPDYSDIAESMASGAATGAIAPMVKSMQSRMSKKKKQNEILWTSDGKDRFDSYEKMDSARRNKVANTPMARAKYADKAPKIDLRKSYPE